MTNGNRRQRGCTKGNKCDLFHPNVCNASLRKRICTNDDCKYLHIKGTVRSAPTTQEEPQPSGNTRQHSRVNPAQTKTTAANTSLLQTAASSDLSCFLGQLKAMSDQMLQFNNKLQQLDQRWNTLQQPALLPMYRPPNLLTQPQFQPYLPHLGLQGQQTLLMPPQTS